MALAGTYNMTVDQGATLSQQWTYRDSNDALVDLTGYTARMQVRESFASPSAVLELTTENGGLTLGGAAGTINLAITATASAALAAYRYVYDLELVTGSTVERLVMGTFTVRGEVTR
jgi:hypothetical protein